MATPRMRRLAKTTQAQIGRYLDDRGHAKMREGAELTAGLSNVYLRVVWDTSLRPRPWTDVLAARMRWCRRGGGVRSPRRSCGGSWTPTDGNGGVAAAGATPGSIEYGLYEG
jgi:hypothetical protein